MNKEELKAQLKELKKRIPYDNAIHALLDKGYIVLKDNYCDNAGTIRCSWKGNSGTKTKIIVCGNCLGSDIQIAPSTGTTTDSTIDVKAWNNTIRS